MNKTLWSFGKLQSALADSHRIASSKRPAMNARVKNLHRLGFPPNFVSSRGKTSFYACGDFVLVALAMELAQLGIAPDFAIRLIDRNHDDILPAIEAASAGLNQGEGVVTYLIFDPEGLTALTHEDNGLSTGGAFRWGGAKEIADELSGDTLQPAHRLSLINLSSMLDRLLFDFHDRTGLLGEITRWASGTPETNA